jgi:hypothetical protein
MKKLTFLLLFLFCTASLSFAEKVRLGEVPPRAKRGVDYPVAVHIGATHIRQNCEYDWQSAIIGGPKHTCPEVVYVDAFVNGKKIELMGQYYQKYTISLGDYKARLTTKAPNADPAAMGQKYELLTPEKYAWRSMVTGVSE